MSCARSPELQALHDDELAPDERAALVLHVEGCAACQDELVALDALSDLVREAAPSPPPDVWRTFDADLRAGLATTPQGLVLLPGGARRLGPALAVAATVAAVALPLWHFSREPEIALASVGSMPRIGLRYSEPEVPPGRGAGPPRDEAAVMAALDAMAPGAGKQLHDHGVVQVRVGAADLDALGDWAPSGTTPLWTADCSLLLAGAAASRAAWALERDVVAPGLLGLLEGALKELTAFEGRSRDAAVTRAARRARELLAVACTLAGGHPALSGESRTRVAAEVAAVRAGRGPRVSPVLQREVDDRAFVPRGLWADGALAGHARAAAWLTRAGLRLDGASPDEARAAALLTLALAAAPGTNGRSGLGELARLEGTLEVLVGPPDGLVAGDLLEALRQVLGRASVRPSDLAPDDLVLDLAERARAEAAARGRDRVGPPGPPELRLVGGTRSLAAEALQRLVDPAVPGRGREASSLDLLALLGSRQARTVLSAERRDVFPGYDAALERLQAETPSWRDTQGDLPARTCLEQGRLWAAGALLDPAATAAGPAGRAYRDRLLLASLAALEAVPPSGAGRPAPRLPAPLVVEPLPRLHARLAFGARRLATALEQVAEGRVAPRVAAALVDLRRVAALEDGLREASVDALLGRGQGQAARDALARAPALLAGLAPADARTASDLLELTGGETRVLHRVVFGLDRLAVVVPDGQGGLVAAIGPALAAGEVWTRGRRLAPADVATTRREDPEWATHLAR